MFPMRHMPIGPSQLDRIEAKLDRLLAALAEDGQDDQGHDLAGNPLPRDRQEGEPL